MNILIGQIWILFILRSLFIKKKCLHNARLFGKLTAPWCHIQKIGCKECMLFMYFFAFVLPKECRCRLHRSLRAIDEMLSWTVLTLWLGVLGLCESREDGVIQEDGVSAGRLQRIASKKVQWLLQHYATTRSMAQWCCQYRGTASSTGEQQFLHHCSNELLNSTADIK